MNTALVGMLNMWEIIGLVVLVMLLFGARKLPELARGLGQGIKEFKKASHEEPPKGS
jgi:sec-independent protein translocase protein TatA